MKCVSQFYKCLSKKLNPYYNKLLPNIATHLEDETNITALVSFFEYYYQSFDEVQIVTTAVNSSQ